MFGRDKKPAEETKVVEEERIGISFEFTYHGTNSQKEVEDFLIAVGATRIKFMMDDLVNADVTMSGLKEIRDRYPNINLYRVGGVCMG